MARIMSDTRGPRPETVRTVGGAGMIAALYVQAGGCYAGLDGVDAWSEDRDARMYGGPWPVVAHPPCQRWGKLWAGSPVHIKRTGERKIKGDDAGCFKSALFDVRTFGGVLEHPWQSAAWPHFSLNIPPRAGGWIKADDHGGWACCVEQGRYGHYARKPTLLYVVGASSLPKLDWGISDAKFPAWAIEKHGLKWCKRAGELSFRGGGVDSGSRIGTPIPFRDILINLARQSACVPMSE